MAIFPDLYSQESPWEVIDVEKWGIGPLPTTEGTYLTHFEQSSKLHFGFRRLSMK